MPKLIGIKFLIKAKMSNHTDYYCEYCKHCQGRTTYFAAHKCECSTIIRGHLSLMPDELEKLSVSIEKVLSNPFYMKSESLEIPLVWQSTCTDRVNIDWDFIDKKVKENE